MPLVAPHPIGGEDSRFNYCAYLNLANINPHKIFMELGPKSSWNINEYGLASYLYDRINNWQNGYKIAVEGFSKFNEIPNWYASNLSVFEEWKNDLCTADKIKNLYATDYKRIFGQDKIIGGIIGDSSCSNSYYKIDNIMIIPPLESILILNLGCVKFLGERQIIKAVEKAKVPLVIPSMESRHEVIMVHNGEAMIPLKAMKYLGGKRAINQGQMLGRIENKSAIKIDRLNKIRASKEYNDIWEYCFLINIKKSIKVLEDKKCH